MKTFDGYLQGINLGGWLSQCEHKKEHYDTFITEEDIKTIASWGLDHVRVPVDYELIQDNMGNTKAEGFLYIDNCLEWCEKYHLNMILDLHKTAGYVFDDFENCNSFFNDEELRKRFFAIWKEFASRYGQYHDRLAFELLNEIVDPNVSDEWNQIAKQTIVLIRIYAPDSHILVGGVLNNSVTTLRGLDMPYDDKIIYNFHFYDPLIFTHQTAQWVKGMPIDFHISYPGTVEEYLDATQKYLPKGNEELYSKVSKNLVDKEFLFQLVRDAVELAKERDVALYCGEYGVIDQVESESMTRWYRDLHEIFEQFHIGRASWSYKEMNFGMTGQAYDEIRKDIRNYL
ncbi:MAG TPA: cellulase family glycosylhydrolase [Lachnospiraceae bacterium]|nr:cellulase family glycosylhydrolase [Lachnospiraceae bacterium]HPF28847.1 cellulase family glycosylhydrolase [Lachnospiraceae bacterium]